MNLYFSDRDGGGRGESESPGAIGGGSGGGENSGDGNSDIEEQLDSINNYKGLCKLMLDHIPVHKKPLFEQKFSELEQALTNNEPILPLLKKYIVDRDIYITNFHKQCRNKKDVIGHLTELNATLKTNFKYSLEIIHYIGKYLVELEKYKKRTDKKLACFEWSQSLIYFFKDFYRFTSEYNKITRVGLPYSYIKRHFRKIKLEITQSQDEKEFWK